MQIALIGNPNSGKTVLFNELTGANQHVGNWPGVTVEQKRGSLRAQYSHHAQGEVVDLPGIYSLSPFSLEEIVSRDYLLGERPDAVINLVDVTNLERHLYLSIQLIELNVPLIIALNMMDELEADGLTIDTEQLAQKLGVAVVGISAVQRTGIDELLSKLSTANPAKRHELPNPHIERMISEVEALLQHHLELEHELGDEEAKTYPLHWVAIKVLEGDELVLTHLTLDQPTLSAIEDIKTAFVDEFGPLSSAFAEARYSLINQIVHGDKPLIMPVETRDEQATDEQTEADDLSVSARAPRLESSRRNNAVLHNRRTEHGSRQYDHEDDSDQHEHSHRGNRFRRRNVGRQQRRNAQLQTDAIDRLLTNRIIGLPVFLLVMFLVFHLTFSENLFGISAIPSPGVFFQQLAIAGVSVLTDALRTLFVSGSWAESLVVDGVVGGVGTVITFVPQIIMLFFFLTLMEDCGYMARAAFIMDRLLRRFGLSGKSFMPMLMGFGCTVPAAMAARTMENENDRRLTLMLVPFMSCGARAPIYLVMAGAFFPASADLIVFSLYALGIVVAMFSGIVLRKLLFKGDFAPFIIELPRYRWPQARSVALTLWDKLKDYLTRAGTVIFAMCVVIWLLSNFGIADGSLKMTGTEGSFLIRFGMFLEPLFTPRGFGFWVAAVAILTGFVAKESVISTLATLLNVSLSESDASSGLTKTVLLAAGFSPAGALAFMVFCMLYIPCVAAFATLRREFGSWAWAIGQAVYSIAIAYVFAFISYQIGGLIFG
jgi:ferrous iron transport protein B